MKQRIKRCLAVLLAASMVTASLPFAAFAEENSEKAAGIEAAEEAAARSEAVKGSGQSLKTDTEEEAGQNSERNPAEETGEAPERKPAEETGQNSEWKSAEEIGENPERNPTEEAGRNSEWKSAEETREKTERNPTEEAGENLERKPAEETGQAPEQKTAEAAGQNPEWKPAEGTGQSTEWKPAEETGGVPEWNPTEETGENPEAEETTEETGQEGCSMGTAVIEAKTPGGKITVTGSDGRQQEIVYDEEAEPFQLREPEGTVIHLAFQAEPEGYEIDSYRISTDPETEEKEELTPGTILMEEELTLEADSVWHAAVWFEETEPGAESTSEAQSGEEKIKEDNTEEASEGSSEDNTDDRETDPEAASEAETATEAEPFHDIHISYDPTVSVALERQQYQPGETVEVMVTTKENYLLNDISLSSVSEEEKLLREAGDIPAEFVGMIGAADGEEGEISSYGTSPEMQAAEETSSASPVLYAFAFEMPKNDVLISTSTMTTFANTAAVSETGNPEDYRPESFTLVSSEAAAAAPAALSKNGADSVLTRIRTVEFQDSEGNQVTKNAYCLQPRKENPGNQDYAAQSLTELQDGSAVAKGLYFLYGGPGWGGTFKDSSGKDVNIRTLLSQYCTTANEYYAISHWILSYLYDADEWNYDGGGNPDPFTEEGKAWIISIANQISRMPSISAGLSKNSITASWDDTVRVYQSAPVKYIGDPSNTGKIRIVTGVSLHNTTKGEAVAGGPGVYASLDGGDTFYLTVTENKAQSVGYQMDFTVSTTYATDFQAYKMVSGGAIQDVGFSYTTGMKSLNLALFMEEREPDPGYVRIRKTSSEPEITAGNSLYSLAGAVFGVYTGANGTGTRAATLTTDASGTTPVSGALKAGTYYVVEETAPAGFLRYTGVKTVTVREGETAEVAFEDVPKTKRIDLAIQKTTNPGTDIPLSGAEFSFQYYAADSAEGSPQKEWILKTDEEGKASFDLAHLVSGDDFYLLNGKVVLPLGTLVVRERKAPAGLQLNSHIWTYAVTDEGVTGGPDGAIPSDGIPVYEPPVYGGVKIRKSGEEPERAADGDATFAGAVFSIINANPYRVVRADTGENGYAPGTEVTRITTDADGNAGIGAVLQAGTYRIKEVKAPEGYELGVQEISFTISAQGQIADKTDTPIQNQVILGGFHFQKADEDTKTAVPQGDATFAGAKFQVLNRSAGSVRVNGTVYPKDAVVMTLTTDETGFASTGKILPYGTYGIVEIGAPEGYSRNFQELTVEVHSAEDLEITDADGRHTWIEPVIRGGFTIRKADKETGITAPQGDASLAGAEFTVTNVSSHPVTVNGKTYAAGEVVLTLATDENGFAETGRRALPYGTYTVKETKAPEGYFPDNTVKTVKITADDQYDAVGYQGTAGNEIFKEQIYRGGFQLEKWDWEVNEAGIAQGDASLAGAEFTLTNLSKHSVVVEGKTYQPNEAIHVFTTDAKGRIETAEDYLPYGTYRIEETRQPAGYTSEGENLSRVFTVREDAGMYDFTGRETAAKNRVIRFDISILKFKDTLSSEEPGERVIPLEGCEFEIRLKSTGELVTTLVTDENGYAGTADPEHYPNGRLPYGTYVVTETRHPDSVDAIRPFEISGQIDRKDYSGIYLNDRPIETPITLVKKSADQNRIIPEAGTEFQILDEEKNILTFTCYYPKVTELTNLVTDESGTVTVPEKLPKGTYYLREVHAPYGYLKGEDIKFTVEEWGSWTEPVPVEYADSPAKGVLRVSKTDAVTGESLKGAVFAVFANEDIITPDGYRHYAKGQYVESLTIGSDGTGQSGELPLGKYYIQEIKAPEGFCLDTSRVEVELCYADEETPVVYADVKRSNLPTTVQLLKSDADGLALNGVSFTLTKIGEKEGSGIGFDGAVDGGNFITRDGTITVRYLKPGIYAVQERSTLPGYIVDEVPRYVTVDENGYLFASDENGLPSDEDKAKSGTETLDWVNDYTKWEFSKTDVTGKTELAGASMEIYDSSGKLVHHWTSDGTVHRVDKLPQGTYTLVEKAAPEGYVLAKPIEFEVLDDGAVHRVTMTDIRVKAHKFDETLKAYVEGASLEVQDMEGNTVDRWITGKEPHYISGLAAGKSYRLVETEAPEGFTKALPVNFTVEDCGEDQEVKMVNKQVFVSKVDTEVLELAGAELEVRDMEGNVIDQWTSDGSPHAVSGLTAGNTYRLMEVKAPKGYAAASPMEFQVTDGAADERLTLVNKQVFVSKVDTTGVRELSGAKLQVLDLDGEVVDAWTSKEKPHPISNIAVNTSYILHEEAAAEGYVVAADIPFTVRDDGKEQTVQMTDKQVLITKYESGGEKLAGAHLIVTDKETGKTADEWISTAEPHAVSGLAVNKTYILTEQAAPAGYLKAAPMEFTVRDDFNIQEIGVENDFTRVEITKSDITDGKPVIGATLILKDKNGKEFERWETTKEPHMIEKLPAGEYTLTELTAPDGYVRAETITFTVEETGEIQKADMKDDYTKVEISKQDLTTGQELAGAKLTLIDSKGRIIDSWTSGTEPHYLEKLPTGDYVLKEEAAPAGYEIAEELTFTVEETGEIQRIAMKDKPIPEEEPPADIPKTGDTTDVTGETVMLMLALAVILGCLAGKRKRIEMK